MVPRNNELTTRYRMEDELMEVGAFDEAILALPTTCNDDLYVKGCNCVLCEKREIAAKELLDAGDNLISTLYHHFTNLLQPGLPR